MAVSVVQTATPATPVSTTATCTFASPVTAGNTICASVSVLDASTSGYTVALTLGSSPDNWLLHRQSRRTASGSNIYTAEWADNNCAGGATGVTVTLSGATGSFSTCILVQAWEVAGLPSASEDGTGAGSGSSTSYTTGSFTPNSTTTAGDEFWWGSVTFPSSLTGGFPSGWTNTAKLTTSIGQAMIAGYQVRTTTGSPLYSGTLSGAGGQWAAAGSTLKAGTVSGTAALSGVGTPSAAGGIEGDAEPGGTGTMTATATSGAPDTASSTGEGTIAATPSVQVAATAAMSGTGDIAALAGSAVPRIVNQWASSEAQNPQFGPSLPVAPTVNVPLTTAFSVGGGSGTPTQGNWLFMIAGWRQDPGNTGVTVSLSEDSQQWSRPSLPSLNTGNTRTTVWYQPNIGAVSVMPSQVYAAPSGYVAGLSVLVIEAAGLGPWDTVTGTSANYASSATSLSLALGSPGAAAFVLAAVTGSSTSAGTKITPAGWTALHTVSASNGIDHTGDTVLAAAADTVLTSVSVSGSATSAESLSGFIISVLAAGPPPAPVSGNPNWPDPVIFEAAFGSGYGTPPDQMTWTNLQTPAAGKRLREWDEDTGIQYELDALEASELTLTLDNPDGALSPFTPFLGDGAANPYYPDVVPGTPVRLRMVPPATTGCNAWIVIQRNIERWPQSWDELFRGLANSTGTDLWSVVNKTLPSCYRAELLAEGANLYAWWPMDDPAVVPLPTSLTNAAPGNSNHLNIVTSPNGLAATLTSPFTAAYSAVQDFAQNSGWMYGDPVSAAWVQSGNGAGTKGRYLSCNDANFPPLSGGVTIEHWFNLAFLGTGSGSGTGAVQGPYTQPPSVPLVLWEIASATAPLASLQVSSSGVLQLVTWSGSTPTIHVIYNTTDVRNTTWTGVTVTLTQTTWAAWVNGGVVAQASGTASMGSHWSWMLVGAGTGNSGAPPTSGTIAGSPNAAHAHVAVYSEVLPTPRIMAHFMAAYAGFGQLPAPALSVQFISQSSAFIGAYAPDGNIYTGMFFGTPGGLSGQPSLAAEVLATGGGLTSGPAVPESVTIQPPVANPADAISGFNWATASGAAVPEYSWYTSQGAGSEELAATTLANYLYIDGYASGAAMPAVPSALGDTVQQRIERILLAGGVTTPARCIDAAASPVVAELDTAGQICGTAVSNITASDGGLLFMSGQGNLCYWDKPHLQAQPVAWVLGPDVGSGQIPFLNSVTWDTDPQKVFNDIEITQASVAPDSTAGTGGASSGSAETQSTGVTFSPSGTFYPAILASQQQNGDSQQQITNYLQSTQSIQNQADWLFQVYGSPVQRITSLTVEAAAMTDSAPQAWLYALGVNPGDVIRVTQSQPGQPSFSGTWRVTHVTRKISFGEGGTMSASAEVIADVHPSIPYWT